LSSASEAVISAELVISEPHKVKLTPCCVIGGLGTVLISLYWTYTWSFTKQ